MASIQPGPNLRKGTFYEGENCGGLHVNSQELFAIERIALAQQTLLRVERLHEGISTTCLNEALSGDGKPLMGISDSLVNGDNEITKAQNRNYLFAEGFHRIN